VNIAGYNWDLYSGPNGSMKVFSFLPSDGSWKLSFNADLKLFFNYLAQNQGFPASQQNLIGKLSQVVKTLSMVLTFAV
jgi:xyloglucan-specific endo-beta-1,4-glucanase